MKKYLILILISLSGAFFSNVSAVEIRNPNYAPIPFKSTPILFDIISNNIIAIVAILLFIILVILIIREINCWYWKINTRVSIQEDTLSVLIDILKEIKTLNGTNTEPKENTSNLSEKDNKKEAFLNEEPKETIEKMKFINL